MHICVNCNCVVAEYIERDEIGLIFVCADCGACYDVLYDALDDEMYLEWNGDFVDNDELDLVQL